MQHLQKTRERGLRTSNRQRLRNAQSDVAHLSFFSTTCAMPILQALSFDIHPSNGGVGGTWKSSVERAAQSRFGPAQGLAESSRRPPAFSSARSVNTLNKEMASPKVRSGVRTNFAVMRQAPGVSFRIISPFVSVRCGVTALPFTSTRHAG